MSKAPIPKLVAGQVITLESSAIKKVQTRFDRLTKKGWAIKVKPATIRQYQSQQKVALLFASANEIFSGDATIIEVDRDTSRIVLSVPTNLVARPRRQQPRKKTCLPTSLILMGVPDQFLSFTNEFIGRRSNVILNISKTGVLLGTASPLPETAQQVMLLMGLNLDDPFNENHQISMSGKIMRSGVSTGDSAYPYGYGIQFNPTFPAFQHALEYFLDQLLENTLAPNTLAPNTMAPMAQAV